MKVIEFIQRLKKYPPDDVVRFFCSYDRKYYYIDGLMLYDRKILLAPHIGFCQFIVFRYVDIISELQFRSAWKSYSLTKESELKFILANTYQEFKIP